MTRLTVLPRYGEASLADLMPSVLGALGLPGEDNILGLPRAPRYCVLLIDGLGWNLLKAHPIQTPFLSSLRGREITCGVPSTTATSLTSLGTGLPPGRHGILGYTTRYPGGNQLFNALKWEPRVDPASYQPHPTMFERASNAGVRTGVLGERRFRESGLTKSALRGPFRSAGSYGQRVAVAAEVTAGGNPALVYVYDSDLDHTGHQSGCGSAAWRHQLVMVDRFAEELYDTLTDDTLLVVTGDHGMVDIAREDRIDVGDHASLREGVALIAGEARFRHVYTSSTDPAAVADVKSAWRQVLGRDRATVVTREEAVELGWFGAVESRVLDRIGDVVVNAHGRCAVEYRNVFPVETKLVGLHGAISDDEMLVPLLTSAG